MTKVHANATKETTPFLFFKSNVAEAAGLTIEVVERFLPRVAAAYDMGEAVWMIADELALRAAAPKKTLSPRSYAVRVVKVGA